MSRMLRRWRWALLPVAALAVLSFSCLPRTPLEPPEDPVQGQLRTAIAGTFTIDELKVEFARMAIWVAKSGCAGAGERLTGEPERVLIALTESASVTGFNNWKTRLKTGPGGLGSVPVFVVAVEGQSGPVAGQQSPINRAFVFVEPLVAPDFTTCKIEWAPLALEYTGVLASSFKFESVEIPE